MLDIQEHPATTHLYTVFEGLSVYRVLQPSTPLRHERNGEGARIVYQSASKWPGTGEKDARPGDHSLKLSATAGGCLSHPSRKQSPHRSTGFVDSFI